jgi:hypothetical protein
MKLKKNARKARKGFMKKRSKILRQRKKTLRVRKRFVHDSFDFNRDYMVKENFDVKSGGKMISVDKGDLVTFKESGNHIYMTAMRNSTYIVSGLSVDESFMNESLKYGVFEPVGENVSSVRHGQASEACTLSYANGGYVMETSSDVLSLGTRMRARSYLISEGYVVNAEMLDNAFGGKKVLLSKI